MAPAWDDDDDWVGEPPEGRHSRDRAQPDFWRRTPFVVALGWFLLGVLALVAILLAT